MEREFIIKVDRTRRVEETVTYRVNAESFEEARDQYDNGYADEYDCDEYDSEVVDETVDEIECNECDSSEGYCECGEGEMTDPTDNPDHDAPGSLHAQALRQGMWFMPADDYTYSELGSHWGWPAEIVSVSDERDDDGEYALRFKGQDGHMHVAYVNDAHRFELAMRPANALVEDPFAALGL